MGRWNPCVAEEPTVIAAATRSAVAVAATTRFVVETETEVDQLGQIDRMTVLQMQWLSEIIRQISV